eukprot:3132061-Pyramimonas_sp.AAC.1
MNSDDVKDECQGTHLRRTPMKHCLHMHDSTTDGRLASHARTQTASIALAMLLTLPRVGTSDLCVNVYL